MGEDAERLGRFFSAEAAGTERENLDAKKDFLEKKLKTSLNKIPEYLEEHQVDKEEFYQAWNMMNGLWNTIDFENIRKIVKLQKEYPELLKVANRMGRIADDEGSKQVYVTEGSVYKLAHSQRAIFGVTIGNDLNALLPSELLYYADSELQDVFMLNTSRRSYKPSVINRKSCSLPDVWKQNRQF